MVAWVRPPENTPQTASRSVRQFCTAHGCDQHTDTRTDRPRYIGSSRPHLMLRITLLWLIVGTLAVDEWVYSENGTLQVPARPGSSSLYEMQ